jgi:hypothetical protein
MPYRNIVAAFPSGAEGSSPFLAAVGEIEVGVLVLGAVEDRNDASAVLSLAAIDCSTPVSSTIFQN